MTKPRPGRTLPRPSGRGIFDFEYGKEVTPHINTWRVIFVGPSNSGKTTACFNVIRDFPRPINSITYIAPISSHSDEGPVKLKAICEKVGIQWNPVEADKKGTIEIPNTLKPEIVIFDDCWKYKKIEPLIDEIFIRGRHEMRHGVFMAQTPAFIPNSCRNNFTYAFIHKDFFNEDTEKKFHFDKGALHDLTPEVGQNFAMFQTGGKFLGFYKPHQYKHKHHVMTVMKELPDQSYKKAPINKQLAIQAGIADAGNSNVKNFPIYEADNTLKTFWSNQFKHFNIT